MKRGEVHRYRVTVGHLFGKFVDFHHYHEYHCALELFGPWFYVAYVGY